jgi:hypothetical protein
MERWPELRYDEWKDTLDTLHLWTQIVGKIRLRLEPLVNHWWNVTLYVTPRGLTTSKMPYAGDRSFSIDFDFQNHRLIIDDCDGRTEAFALEPMSVATFYRKLMDRLASMDIHVKIYGKPNEVVEAIPFASDETHRSYDAKYVERFWCVLLQVDRLCKVFRADFLGKASPVHFFWGSFDMAVTLFSGRPAPPHPGGFPNMPDASFYGYAYPEPSGLADAKVDPEAAGWNGQLREFVLPYAAVLEAADRDCAVLDFFRSVYAAAATLGGWDRKALERAR